MAVYATSDDVLARAGRFAGLFQVTGKRPDADDLDAILVTVSAIIDAEIRARGYDPDSLTDELVESLRDVAAWAVLVRALPEASPGDNALEPTLERGKAILEASGFKALGAASNVMDAIGSLATLEAGEGGGGAGTSAGSFWDSLPEDWVTGRLSHRSDVTLVNGSPPDEFGDGVDAEPQFRRGMSL